MRKKSQAQIDRDLKQTMIGKGNPPRKRSKTKRALIGIAILIGLSYIISHQHPAPPRSAAEVAAEVAADAKAQATADAKAAAAEAKQKAADAAAEQAKQKADAETEASNKRRSEALESAILTAMNFDPHLKYELGVFHALDLTLSSLNSSTANAIANRVCNTYHLNGGLRVYLVDGSLAAQCDFLPNTTTAVTTPAATTTAVTTPAADDWSINYLGCLMGIADAEGEITIPDAQTNSFLASRTAAEIVADSTGRCSTTGERLVADCRAHPTHVTGEAPDDPGACVAMKAAILKNLVDSARNGTLAPR